MDGMHQVDVAVMDPQITAMSTSPYTDVPPQQDVDEFLRKKRKAREHKACYPCRQRKVKSVLPGRVRPWMLIHSDATSIGHAKLAVTAIIPSYAHITRRTNDKASILALRIKGRRTMRPMLASLLWVVASSTFCAGS